MKEKKVGNLYTNQTSREDMPSAALLYEETLRHTASYQYLVLHL